MFTAVNFPCFCFWATFLLLLLSPTIEPVQVTVNRVWTTTKINMAKSTTLKEFEAVFPKLVEDILGHAKQYNLPEEFVKWYKAVS